MLFYPLQKFKKYHKRVKHAAKIPSSLGLFIVDSSCFFVSGPRVQEKKGGKREKRKFKKDYWQKKRKEKKIKKDKKSKKR